MSVVCLIFTTSSFPSYVPSHQCMCSSSPPQMPIFTISLIHSHPFIHVHAQLFITTSPLHKYILKTLLVHSHHFKCTSSPLHKYILTTSCVHPHHSIDPFIYVHAQPFIDPFSPPHVFILTTSCFHSLLLRKYLRVCLRHRGGRKGEGGRVAHPTPLM